jgi:SNF2 family DNA or RNA helicase
MWYKRCILSASYQPGLLLHNALQGAAAAEQVKDFKQGTVWKLLVGSYETLRKYAHELEGCCDLLVCDEGHRLKASGGNKTITALLQLGCQRRIILTGTPVQNNMEEFYGRPDCSACVGAQCARQLCY